MSTKAIPIHEAELELTDLGCFKDQRCFAATVEYAKYSPHDSSWS